MIGVILLTLVSTRALSIVIGVMVLTAVTVGVYFLLDVSTGTAITLALIIATIKASLVACFFMHLISEKKLIYAVLILTVVFFFALLFLPVMTSLADQAMS